MTSLSAHQSAKIVKCLYIGNSGVGKTGSMVSLVKAGYKLRVLDMDNGLDALRKFIQRECPEKIDAVQFETLRDKIVSTPTGPVVRAPKAMVAATTLLNKWSDDTVPGEWGEDTILVLDSLTAMGRAAFEWAKGMNPSAKDPRQWYFAGQQAIENIIALLTSEAFGANVIVISHIAYVEMIEGNTRGFPTSLGSAQGNVIPRYFNTMISAESTDSGKKRIIRTVPTNFLDLKNPAPFTLGPVLPLESGLADLFGTIKGGD